ncbi:MAG: pyridoxine 5'-phosphate synthase [Elusimicrobia bacterium]|nr:pyridoxine 5'-phosphate synthase [Elusimicrobiota bacterium]
MIKLGVNIDHVATLRQARQEGIPDILEAAYAVERGGGDSITIHLREDRRHIQDEDAFILKNQGPLMINFEMSAAEEMVNIALKLHPRSVCLVPEKREELTTEGGLDVLGDFERIKEVTGRLSEAGIEVALFLDSDEKQIDAAARVGAAAVELHTGRYANSFSESDAELKRLIKAAQLATSMGLIVNAGHGLNYSNVKEICAIEGVNELNIGYSIVCRAIFVGLESAVREMRQLIP